MSETAEIIREIAQELGLAADQTYRLFTDLAPAYAQAKVGEAWFAVIAAGIIFAVTLIAGIICTRIVFKTYVRNPDETSREEDATALACGTIAIVCGIVALISGIVALSSVPPLIQWSNAPDAFYLEHVLKMIK